MDRKPYDWFAQELLTEVLSKGGRPRVEVKVTRTAQFIDLTFVPGLAHRRVRKSLGLLGEMTRESCLLEVFRGVPSASEVLECVNKQLTLHHQHDLRAQKMGRRRPQVPWRLWVVSSGRPRRAMAALKLAPREGVPRGVYEGPLKRLPWGLVVVKELPAEPSTLLVRLLGPDRAMERASQEVAMLPCGDGLRETAEQLMVELWMRVEQDPNLTEREKERLRMATQTLLESYNKRVSSAVEKRVEKREWRWERRRRC